MVSRRGPADRGGTVSQPLKYLFRSQKHATCRQSNEQQYCTRHLKPLNQLAWPDPLACVQAFVGALLHIAYMHTRLVRKRAGQGVESPPLPVPGDIGDTSPSGFRLTQTSSISKTKRNKHKQEFLKRYQKNTTLSKMNTIKT